LRRNYPHLFRNHPEAAANLTDQHTKALEASALTSQRKEIAGCSTEALKITNRDITISTVPVERLLVFLLFGGTVYFATFLQIN
jgi:hypothetical protein